MSNRFWNWLMRVLGVRHTSHSTIELKGYTMAIQLILGTALTLQAVERNAKGADITGEKLSFVTSDPTIFTVAADETDPTKPVFTPVGVGSAVFSIFDEANANLHNSYDVVVAPAPATEIDLLNADGTVIAPDAPAPTPAPGPAPTPAPADGSGATGS